MADETYRKVSDYLCKENHIYISVDSKISSENDFKGFLDWQKLFLWKKVVSNVFKSIKKHTIQNSLRITFYIIHNFFFCFAIVYQTDEVRKW